MGIAHNCHSEANGRGICFFGSLALLLCCLATPPIANAEELGRLFLTPEQRQILDRQRATNRAEEEAPQIKEGPLTVDGHVQRSSGKTATWVNGVPQYDAPASPDPALVTVVPNAGEPGVRLKVGETYERTNSKVHDSLEGGEITVGKSSRKAPPGVDRAAAAKPPVPGR